MRPGGPNVLVVVLDTARADHFGPYGAPFPTPGFDEWARRGRVHANAVAPAPWTLPSHASMFTGLLPSEHGLTGTAAMTDDLRIASLRPAIERLADRWLPEVFRRAGYETMAAVSNVWLTSPMGFDVGFERHAAIGMGRVAPPGDGAAGRVARGVRGSVRGRARRLKRALYDYAVGRDFGAAETLRLLHGLAAPRQRPFFCFVNVMEAHAPYMPPAPFNPLPRSARLRAGRVDRYFHVGFVTAYNLGAAELPERDVTLLRRLYEGEVRYLDRFLSLLLEALEPVLEDTVVVLTSDHGENLGEDHLLGHQISLDARLVRVPLVVAGAASDPLLDRPVFSLAWLPALLASAAGLGDAPWGRPEGDVAVAQYESGRAHLRRHAPQLDALELHEEARARFRAPMQLATDGRATLLSVNGRETVEGPTDALPRLRAALAGAPFPDATSGGYTPREEAEIEERLGELGYL